MEAKDQGVGLVLNILGGVIYKDVRFWLIGGVG